MWGGNLTTLQNAIYYGPTCKFISVGILGQFAWHSYVAHLADAAQQCAQETQVTLGFLVYALVLMISATVHGNLPLIELPMFVVDYQSFSWVRNEYIHLTIQTLHSTCGTTFSSTKICLNIPMSKLQDITQRINSINIISFCSDHMIDFCTQVSGVKGIPLQLLQHTMLVSYTSNLIQIRLHALHRKDRFFLRLSLPVFTPN